MNGKIICVDYSGNAISLVLVTLGRNGHQIAACEQVRLTGGDEWNGAAEAIAKIQEMVDMRDVTCVASLPDDWISCRIVSMPFADRKKISRIIAYEMEPLMPFSSEDIVIDFQPLGSSQSTSTGTDFFAAVVSKSRLKDFIEKVNTLGLEPEIITCRGFAVTSVLSAYKETGIVVDGDAQRLIAGGFTGGQVRFVHPFRIGRNGKRRAQRIVEAVNHILIADQERQQADFKPVALFVTDRLAELAGLKEAVVSSLDLTAVRTNIADASGVFAGDCGDDTGQVIDGFDVALCLALLKRVNRPFINFRKDEFAVTGKWRQYSDVIIRTGLIAALVIVMGLSGFFYDLKNAREQIAAVNTSITEVFTESFPDVPLIDVDDPLLQMRVELERLKGKIGLPPEMDRKAYCVDILNDISRFVPPESDVVIERMVVGPEDVSLSGSTDSFNAVDTLKSEFEKSLFFGNIDISSATMSKVDKRVNFKLRLELL